MGERPAVLVVDDDEGALEALEGILGERFEVEVCISPAFAVQRVEQKSFDLICTDFHMPVMNGVELLTEIARVDPRPGHMVVTGERDQFLRALAVEPMGGLQFLFKPCVASELIAMATRLSDSARRKKSKLAAAAVR